ncbi:MAG: aminomethyltransferase family protein [Nocardiopsaceae bacterium]|nr:aminomethyltransferase family protein [Nocardiopsaceae bacterium]
MTKESGFHPRLEALTGQWMDLFGYWAPTVVTDAIEEYRAVRETAGLMDFSMLRKVDVNGERAVELVNSIVTRDVAKLRPGRIAYGALCDADGKMIDDCTVMMRDPTHVRFCGANDRDVEILAQRAPAFGVEVREFTDAMPHLCVQGPASRDILAPLASADISGTALGYYRFTEDVRIGGIPVFLTRMGYTAELGYELWVDRDRALELWDLLVEAGGPAGMKVIGMDALDLFRIEGGFIIGGVEYDSTVSPYECGLGWAVKLDKGEFQGREGLLRDREATRLRLTSVVLDDGGAEATGAALYVDGAEAGVVTQAIASPYLAGRTLGLAKVDKDHAKQGTPVRARFGGRTVPGEVTGHPVYQPGRERAKLS